MLKVVKIRIYPDSSKKLALAKAFGSCRWVWNHFLNLMNETYKETGKGLSGYDVKKLLPQFKKQEETAWLSETYSQCLQQVCLNLGVAFKNFFERRAKYPNFKSKHGQQSLQYPSNVSIKDDCLKVPKIGLIDAKFHRPIEGKIKTVTITKNCCNQYFASILCDEGKEKPLPSSEGKAVGIDLGLTHFWITSEGAKFENPKILNKHQKILKRKQQQLSPKEKGSKNRNKARLKVGKVHQKITNFREDFLHKLSRRIVDDSQVIVLENLKIKGMVKNPCLAKARQQVGWGMFGIMLRYKAELEGKVYLEVYRFFPSSKTCHVCLNRVDSLPLEIRYWECPKCKTKHDRDLNAAINITDEGLRILKTDRTGDKACRQTVRRSKGGRKQSTTTLVSGQEVHTVPSGQCG
ncbi:MAG: IS200/IS605 family element transposase accessory protein TnpB [Moorea sp. SIO2B7]|nr:IS200/IS605 family element transposase accessory protein TnpB [Moorena sp. SIO2B7]